MGTSDFAVPSLDILYQHGFAIAAVVTAPDKPSGRGLKVRHSAVKQYAAAHQLPVLQPVKLKDPQFIEELRRLKADIQVVVAFRMLPETVWSMPPLGTINLHASLLPQYRGAAPINRAVMNGEKETGVTTFKLQQEIDTGEIIDQQKMAIGEDETAGELHDRLMIEGARLLLKTLRAIASGNYKTFPQPALQEEAVRQAPKIFREDCRISWEQGMAAIHNHIRGLSPHPTAWTTLNGKVLKVYLSEKRDAPPLPAVGTVKTDYHSYLRIAVKDGWIDLKEVQLEGKKRMDIAGFLRGYREQNLTVE